ncbi:MAG TPA: LysE family translocator [Rhodoferax sp.]|nr:LysE family translocator [Rhodoferax sp.]
MFHGIDNLGLFVAAGIVLNLTPGPDVLFIVTQALKSGWRTGAVAALGITAGCFVHIVAAALGVSALMAASGTAFAVLKWLGAAYLVYVGWSMLGLGKRQNATKSIAASAVSTGAAGINHYRSVLIRGFWTNALNPKVALFFLAFLPQFIAPAAEHKTLAFLLLGLVFNANGLWVNLGYAALAAALSQRFARLQQGLGWLQRVAGVLFIGFGLKLALTDNPAN